MFFGCTGLFIPTESGTDATSVLTSASLVRSFDDENKIIDNLKVSFANFSILLFSCLFTSKSIYLVHLFLLN